MKAALLVAGGIVVCCALILAGQPTALEDHASSLLPAPCLTMARGGWRSSPMGRYR